MLGIFQKYPVLLNSTGRSREDLETPRGVFLEEGAVKVYIYLTGSLIQSDLDCIRGVFYYNFLGCSRSPCE